VPLSELAGSDEIVVLRAGEKVRVPGRKARPDDARLGDVYVERDDHRDETPVPAIVDGKQGSKPRNNGVGAREVIVLEQTGLEVFNDSIPASAADPAVVDAVVDDPFPLPDPPIG
jgi:hypothetical protein